MNKNKKLVSPLPVIFLSSLFFISILNIDNFLISYQIAIEENIDDKQKAFASIESKYTNSFSGKTNYIDLNGLFARMIDKKEINDVIKLNSGYLTQLVRMNPNVNVESILSNTIDFRDYLNLYSIPFLQVYAPYMILDDNDSTIPLGYTVTVNQKADSIKTLLLENDIMVLDLREELLKDENAPTDFYYKTEPHWRIEAAFWAHKIVAQKIDSILENSYSNHDYFDINNYTVTSYPNNTLGGGVGERVGIFYAGVSDASLIVPNYVTNFHVVIPNKNWDKTGTFEESLMLYDEVYSNSITPFTHNIYRIFPLYGEDSFIDNLECENEVKILILHDSFSKALVPYLSLHYKEVYMHDLSLNSEENMLEKIHIIQPDIIINISAIEVMGDMRRFKFLTSSALLELEENKD